MNFKSMPQGDVPQGRNGKHKEIVTRILSDLDQVGEGHRTQGAAGATVGKQGKGPVRVESRDPKQGPSGGDRQRRHLLVYLDGNA